MEPAAPECNQLASLAILTTLAPFTYLNSQREMGKNICGMAILEVLKEPVRQNVTICNQLASLANHTTLAPLAIFL